MTLYKNELEKKASELQKELLDKDIKVSFDEKSFRDYLVMLDISSNGKAFGKASLYFKPSKNTYSLRFKSDNEAIEKKINSIWDNINGCRVYDAESGIYENFVDGSYISGVTGYGSVIYLGDKLKAKLSGTVIDTEFRQFGGELKSVIETLKWCEKNNITKIRINYDYQGIEKFATGEWKPKNALSKEYAEFVKKAKTDIEWRHIRSHTGNFKNDEADALAKKAAGETSNVPNKRLTVLENKALAFIEFINAKERFVANYAGTENGEYIKIKVADKKSGFSEVIDIIYAKANSMAIRQQKSAIEKDIYDLWQEFLLFEDFNV